MMYLPLLFHVRINKNILPTVSLTYIHIHDTAYKQLTHCHLLTQVLLAYTNYAWCGFHYHFSHMNIIDFVHIHHTLYLHPIGQLLFWQVFFLFVFSPIEELMAALIFNFVRCFVNFILNSFIFASYALWSHSFIFTSIMSPIFLLTFLFRSSLPS